MEGGREETAERKPVSLRIGRSPVSVLAAVECDHSSRKAVEMAEYMRLRRQVLQEALKDCDSKKNVAQNELAQEFGLEALMKHADSTSMNICFAC